jgi:eukaryotic-like serine/threonine-protein kinase
VTPLDDRAVEHLRTIVARPATPADRYVVHELIARGGMGEVYRAVDTALGRDVALKVLPLAAAPGMAQRLEREARVLARLEHPGIVPVHDAGALDDGRLYYVMRLVRGRRLDEYSRAGATHGERLRVFLRLCDAVAFAHAQGVIHRDLKPGNIMIGPFGEVLVLDWGVARVLLEETPAPPVPDEPGPPMPDEPSPRRPGARSLSAVTAEGAIVGTPGFMAPEQAAGLGATADQRADVFALGVILGGLLAAADAPAPRPLRSIVARATASNAAARYPGADALAEDVRRWLDGEAVAAHDETLPERTVRLFRRHQTAILLLLTYAVVRVAILLWRGI